jgi:hypothetical protein
LKARNQKWFDRFTTLSHGKGQSPMLKPDGVVESRKKPFSVIPAEVPRRARDPEFTEGAGIQSYQEVLDPGWSLS